MPQYVVRRNKKDDQVVFGGAARALENEAIGSVQAKMSSSGNASNIDIIQTDTGEDIGAEYKVLFDIPFDQFRTRTWNSQKTALTSKVSYGSTTAAINGLNSVLEFTGADLSESRQAGNTGYEFTGGFIERTTGQSGSNDIGSDFEYTQAMADSKTWKRFGFSTSQQDANDNEYWGETSPDFDQTKGLFGGLNMPTGFTQMFDFSDTSNAAAVTSGNLQYTYAPGSYDFKQGYPGMFAQIRFSYNITPMVANTTVETAVIWSTRNSSDVVTFTFPLAAQPVLYDSNTVGDTFLSRIEITAYFASAEDVNARALPAIRANNRVIVQPLSTLLTLSI